MTLSSKLCNYLMVKQAVGKEKAIPLETISNELGISRRELSELKKNLMQYGVMSSKSSKNGGYYIAKTIEDVLPQLYRDMSHRDEYNWNIEQQLKFINKIDPNYRQQKSPSN